MVETNEDPISETNEDMSKEELEEEIKQGTEDAIEEGLMEKPKEPEKPIGIATSNNDRTDPY